MGSFVVQLAVNDTLPALENMRPRYLRGFHRPSEDNKDEAIEKTVQSPKLQKSEAHAGIERANSSPKAQKAATFRDLSATEKQKIARLIEELAKCTHEKQELAEQLDIERASFHERIERLREQNQQIISEAVGLRGKFNQSLELLRTYQQRVQAMQEEREKLLERARLDSEKINKLASDNAQLQQQLAVCERQVAEYSAAFGMLRQDPLKPSPPASSVPQPLSVQDVELETQHKMRNTTPPAATNITTTAPPLVPTAPPPLSAQTNSLSNRLARLLSIQTAQRKDDATPNESPASNLPQPPAHSPPLPPERVVELPNKAVRHVSFASPAQTRLPVSRNPTDAQLPSNHGDNAIPATTEQYNASLFDLVEEMEREEAQRDRTRARAPPTNSHQYWLNRPLGGTAASDTRATSERLLALIDEEEGG